MYTTDPATITDQMQDAHQRTLALLDGLNDTQLMGPKLATVNPLRWEVGHAAYFYEYWVLRQHLGQASIRANSDNLYDSITIAHDDRWDLPLPSLADTLSYIETVLQRVSVCLTQGSDAQRDYLAQYAVFHHDMHNEAYTYTRQTLQYPAPDIARAGHHIMNAGGLAGDVAIPGGQFMLGASAQDGFVFDNEKWAHPLTVEPFSIARAAVSNADFLAFVEEGGYQKKHYWSEAGWGWRESAALQQPVYWRKATQGWQIRQFDQWHPLALNAALIHVSWHEAQAYCRWAHRRLPTELEWEVAAAGQPSADGKTLAPHKRYFPWGEQAPRADQANLNGYALGTVDVGAHAAGDSAFGCRQMIGNVWEWTQDDFGPYPDFTPDMYADYSQPLFGNTKVLRGGAWTTQARMIRNSWRTYYGPDRNDVFAGFRTCAL
ncbi:MAG: ergothioneine biosynthesis protein EgtB [Gammaproteobacteria bacterium]|nr:ergothioneine biosynthesis protein EgtB [Gammaproteobacteria bacterium]